MGGAGMKIVEMKIHSIAIADPPLRSSYGLHAPYALRTIMEIKSEDGVVGVSETYGGDAPAKALEELRPEFQPKSWQAFMEHGMSGRSAADVARELGVTVGAVYAAKFRVMSRLREELQGLLE